MMPPQVTPQQNVINSLIGENEQQDVFAKLSKDISEIKELLKSNVKETFKDFMDEQHKMFDDYFSKTITIDRQRKLQESKQFGDLVASIEKKKAAGGDLSANERKVLLDENRSKASAARGGSMLFNPMGVISEKLDKVVLTGLEKIAKGVGVSSVAKSLEVKKDEILLRQKQRDNIVKGVREDVPVVETKTRTSTQVLDTPPPKKPDEDVVKDDVKRDDSPRVKVEGRRDDSPRMKADVKRDDPSKDKADVKKDEQFKILVDTVLNIAGMMKKSEGLDWAARQTKKDNSVKVQPMVAGDVKSKDTAGGGGGGIGIPGGIAALLKGLAGFIPGLALGYGQHVVSKVKTAGSMMVRGAKAIASPVKTARSMATATGKAVRRAKTPVKTVNAMNRMGKMKKAATAATAAKTAVKAAPAAKVASTFTKAPFKTGIKAGAKIGRALGPAADIAMLGYGAYEGATMDEDAKKAEIERLRKANSTVGGAAWESTKTFFNPMQQGKNLAVAARETVGIGTDVSAMMKNKASAKAMGSKVLERDLQQLSQVGASERELQDVIDTEDEQLRFKMIRTLKTKYKNRGAVVQPIEKTVPSEQPAEDAGKPGAETEAAQGQDMSAKKQDDMLSELRKMNANILKMYQKEPVEMTTVIPGTSFPSVMGPAYGTPFSYIGG
jgi:hypothetical protein